MSKNIKCQQNGIFFTTSHRRSPCNGIGGAVKVLTANASLQGKKRSFE